MTATGNAPLSSPTPVAVPDVWSPRGGSIAHVEKQLVQVVFAYIACAAVWLLIGTAIGLYVALKFVWPDFGVASWLSEPRLRPVHTNLVLYGWASLAQIG